MHIRLDAFPLSRLRLVLLQNYYYCAHMSSDVMCQMGSTMPLLLDPRLTEHEYIKARTEAGSDVRKLLHVKLFRSIVSQTVDRQPSGS